PSVALNLTAELLEYPCTTARNAAFRLHSVSFFEGAIVLLDVARVALVLYVVHEVLRCCVAVVLHHVEALRERINQLALVPAWPDCREVGVHDAGNVRSDSGLRVLNVGHGPGEHCRGAECSEATSRAADEGDMLGSCLALSAPDSPEDQGQWVKAR